MELLVALVALGVGLLIPILLIMILLSIRKSHKKD